MFGLTACTTERSWEVRGRVVGFGDDGRTVFVAHENIPGLMPAMTMPFQVVGENGTRGLEHGDEIAFVLHANADSSWISNVGPLPPDAPPLVLAEESASTGRTTPVLALGDAAPDVELVNQDDRPVSISEFRGRYLLINFIYTRCPLPDYCPWMTRRFAVIQDTLLKRDMDDVSLLTVTIDPAYDRPEVLRAYADRHAGALDNWTFATGTEEDVRTLAEAFGVAYTAQGSEVVHSLTTALVDTTGVLRATWRGQDWTPEDVLARISFLSNAR